MLAIVCPGQGSQTPGFLAPWLELPAFRERLEALSDVAGLDLVAHGTTSDAETIKDTAVAQPLIVAAGLAAAAVALPHGPAGTVAVTAGHSVGEITSAAFAGVLSDHDAMVFVRERGAGMAAASALTPTGMSAVLGGDAAEVADQLARHGLTAANANGAGQTVAAGTLDQLAALAADPPTKARVIPLQVAGAFHTSHMSPAVEALTQLSADFDVSDPGVTLLSNADGQPVADGADALARLVKQVSSPVRWDLCMQTMTDLGVTALVELAPAGTLVGLAKRAMPGVATLAVKTPDDLEAAQQLVRDHGGDPAAARSIPTDAQEA
ncbi:[acyl-carrier-protein] S-malonyltransferase [Pedococcus dokdonensis]|uniref:[acyl-carrier-protein] S-malonyltransferase n=1 Tax=Pedococcus dokdonensis TaxID=443156 RepID=A0A1H0PYC4_9MICO|nr:ACP S-malonyltransferase [Pedococcus dokdonensis]SDP10034.1 [acyl-carrier-protein] S-malonyltransferase [Pedococcus dokdonensis]